MRNSLDELACHVMDTMADDWESIDQIVPHVERWLGPSERSRVASVLVDLISEGLVHEMHQVDYEQLTVDMILQMPVEFWFSMSQRGVNYGTPKDISIDMNSAFRQPLAPVFISLIRLMDLSVPFPICVNLHLR
jgi:hypothetical protein